MNYRQPTIEELFPNAYKKQLLDFQSTHLVNNSLAKGGITEGFEGMPTNISINKTLENDIVNDKITKSLVGNYIKNNWQVMLGCILTGGLIIYIARETFQNKKRKKEKR